MRKYNASLYKLAAAVFVFTMVAISCGKGSETLVRFVSIPGEIPLYTDAGFDNRVPDSRVPAGGYIYVVATRKNVLVRREPQQLVPGTDFVITGLPYGSFESLALYYSPVLLADNLAEQLPLPGDSLDSFWTDAASSRVAESLLANSGAVALFRNLPVKRFKKNIIEAALVPLSSELFEGPNGAPPRCADTNGAIRKQFIRLEPNGAGSIYVMLSNFDGAGIVYAGTVSLYSASGAKLETKTFNRDIPADGPESVMFALPFDSHSYLYLEYASRGERALPLFYF